MQHISPEALAALVAARMGQHPLLLALDGRCGSGKTTLAAALARRFPGSTTIHNDDFYLPPSQRTADWEHIPCANMDLERLRTEILLPARAGQALSCRAYSCREGAYLPPVLLPPASLVIVEGSYSCHPGLAPLYDMRVFVTCGPEEQARRLRAREGDRYPAFAQRWIPLEEKYFAKYNIPANSDFIIRTDPVSSAKP